MPGKRIRVDSYFPAQSKAVTALNRLLKRLQSTEADEYDRIPAVVLMAFSIEAYINRLCAEHHPDWPEIERKPWRWKLKALLSAPDWQSAPLTFAVELFEFRDRMAHGKPFRVEGPVLGGWEEVNEYSRAAKVAQPDWFAKIDNDWMRGAEERFVGVMTYLARAKGQPDHDYLHTSSTYAVELGD